MTKQEAEDQALILNTHKELSAEVVRILPEDIDPIVEGDNGWDVEITVMEDW